MSGPSGSNAQAANRILALRELKFKKTSKQPHPNGSASSDTSMPATGPAATYTLPAQSRDGTVRSPYFFASPQATLGTVLAPNSSPSPPMPPTSTSSNLTYKPHQSHFFNPVFPSDYLALAPARARREPDPLSAPSGFTTSSWSAMPGNRPQQSLGLLSRQAEEEDEDPGPPRKRINRGSSANNPFIIMSSPEGKDSIPLRSSSQPRVEDSDSDEPHEPLDYFSPLKSRLIRGRRPEESNIDSVELNSLVMSHPMHTRADVIAAYNMCAGDVRAAAGLISDPNWKPPMTLSHIAPSHTAVSTPSSTPSASGGSGKNRRAEEKEKGKKSMIYAKRQALPAFQADGERDEGKQSMVHAMRSGATAQVELSPEDLTTSLGDILPSPLALKPPKRKAPRRIVDSSGSEAQYSDDYDSDVKGKMFSQSAEDESYNAEVVKWFNDCEPEALVELAGITLQQATTLISFRPFLDAEDLRSKLSRKNKTGLSSRILEYCSEIFKGYRNVDDVLEGCERVGDQLRMAISRWSKPSVTATSASKETTPFDDADGALTLDSLPIEGPTGLEEDYIAIKPSLLADTVQLKDYQLLGVNWMNLLYKKGLSCILADEMGLGKTVQVIAFLALRKEQGCRGPHLIIVPSSTLENWIREFDRFAPPMEVQAYYGSQKDRIELRSHLGTQNWDVLITTYNLAQGDERDRKFFRKFDWQCCIFDEGHVLKNFDSQRYHHLMKIDSKWRLLLTGTPLQNNLQELVSLMNFILPRYFADVINNLRAIFKVKADKHLSLLSRDRISRAKKMMTPFVLRRRKDTVLKDLPKKTERIEWCDMTTLQKSIYRDALQRSRKAVLDATGSTTPSETEKQDDKGKKRPRGRNKTKDTSTNVLMDLRKAASHPMLFRRLFDDRVIKTMARQCMKEPEFISSNYDFIVEDMEVMTDAELQMFSLKYKSTKRFAKQADCFLDAGKISTLLSLLNKYDEQNRRVLIFSQFTQILDILQAVLRYRKTKFLVLTGSTPVDVRQSLVDEFNEDNSIGVFLLSTKAGGMGINLTAASVVVLFDQDFNPHNDRQAADRAYRIGQKHDVEVIKLITKATIEEDMYRLGQTKLALDEAVAGEDAADGDEDRDDKAEKKMRTSLLSVLRDQFEKEQREESQGEAKSVTNDNNDAETEEDKDVMLVE